MLVRYEKVRQGGRCFGNLSGVFAEKLDRSFDQCHTGGKAGIRHISVREGLEGFSRGGGGGEDVSGEFDSGLVKEARK